MTTLISAEPVLWSLRTCWALFAATREITSAMTAVTPHGTKVTGVAPMRTPTPLPSSQSREPKPDRIDKPPRVGRKPAENRYAGTKNPARESSRGTAHESDDTPTAWPRGSPSPGCLSTFAASRSCPQCQRCGSPSGRNEGRHDVSMLTQSADANGRDTPSAGKVSSDRRFSLAPRDRPRKPEMALRHSGGAVQHGRPGVRDLSAPASLHRTRC